MGLDKARAGSGCIQLTPDEMARHEAYMRVRLEEAEVKAKEDMIRKLKWYEKKEGVPIATEVIPQDGKTVDLPKPEVEAMVTTP
jgi:hypothetical protein